MKLKSWVLLTLFFVFFTQIADCQSQIIKNHYQINWKEPLVFTISETQQLSMLNFDGAVSGREFSTLPYFLERVRVDNFYKDYECEISAVEYADLTSEEIALIPSTFNCNELRPTATTKLEKKVPFAEITFVPIVKRAENQFAKVVSFELTVTAKSLPTKAKGDLVYADNSVLSTGGFYRMAITKTGLYKVTCADMKNMGMAVSGIPSSRIAVYGNGGGPLPEMCGERPYDDLQENAIAVYDGGDGIFNDGDYIVFYGQGPHAWNYANGKFSHKYNIYSDYAYYFITVDHGPGKRVATQNYSDMSPTRESSDYVHYDFYERDGFNFGESGQKWFCDTFDLRTTRSYPFAVPPIVQGSAVRVSVAGAAAASASSSFGVAVNGQSVGILAFSAATGDYKATENSRDFLFAPTATPSDITLTYSKPNTSAAAYLDWIELQARCKLQMHSGQFPFCEPEAVGEGMVTAYHIASASAQTVVWDVTEPTTPTKMSGSLTNGTFTFNAPGDVLRRFVAFNGTSFYTPIFQSRIDNQNLHATGNVDMVIVAHPDFLAQAERLAEFRNSHDGLSVKVVTPQQIYNEFSSGACDVSAIRDYLKMIYDRSAGKYPQYLLLFGRPSFDYRGRLASTRLMVPNYQSNSLLVETDFRANDDYFGILDDGEGEDCYGYVDVAVGRFPVLTAAQAKLAVDKTIMYAETRNLVADDDYATVSNLADWRNMLTFVADDEDGTTHIATADEIAQIAAEMYPVANQEKIYFDAYEQVSRSAAQRYPEVNAAINSRMMKGALVFTYVGHGGKDGWATERVLERPDINSWTNLYNQPLMITLTCEFAWYDRAAISPAELCFLNAKGGTSAMVTTARVAFTYNNDQYGKAFFRNMFVQENGRYPTIGEMNLKAKNACGGAGSGLNMIYVMGDPSQRLAIPQYAVVTDMVNGQPVVGPPDTVQALSEVVITGRVVDAAGNTVNDFNGYLFPSVYDKKKKTVTLQNDAGSDAYEFEVRKNLLYKGKTAVTNGEFEFSFFVPKDIDYSYGSGKISYYARSENADAAGCYENLIIGGSIDSDIDDEDGPEMALYMNDESFVNGGMTDPNPTLLVKLSDEYGINTTGNGLGHDMVAFLDGNTDKQYVLNDFYEASQDLTNGGIVRYKFENLTPGPHSVKVRVWDILNNPAEAVLDFVVSDSPKLLLDNVISYPNPFTTHTSFVFEHNRPDSDLDITIYIYSFSGALVRTIKAKQFAGGYRSIPIEWNGCDNQGARVARGVYLYRLHVTDSNGEKAEKTEKVIKL